MKQMNLVPINSKKKVEYDAEYVFFKNYENEKPIITVRVSKKLVTAKVRAKALRKWYGELEENKRVLLEEMIRILKHYQIKRVYRMNDWVCFAMKQKEKEEGTLWLCFSERGSFFTWEVKQVICPIYYHKNKMVQGPIYVQLKNGNRAVLLSNGEYYDKVEKLVKLGKCGYLLKVNNEILLLDGFGKPISNTMTKNKKEERIEISDAKCIDDTFLLVTTKQGRYVLVDNNFDKSILVDTVPRKEIVIEMLDKLYVAEQNRKNIYFVLPPYWLTNKGYHGKVASDYKVINQGMLCLKIKNKWYPITVLDQTEDRVIEDAYQYDYLLLKKYQESLHKYSVKDRYFIQIIKEEGYVDEIIEMIRCIVSKKYTFDLKVHTISDLCQEGKEMATYQEFILSDVTCKTLKDKLSPCLQNKEASVISIKYKKNLYYFILTQ